MNAFVRKLTGYAPLGEREVRLPAEAPQSPRKVAALRDLVCEGEKSGPVFFVFEGWACRYKILPEGSRQIVAFMMPGDSYDPHMGSLDEMDHSVGTITRCQIASIPPEKMEALIVATPTLTRSFWRAQLIGKGVSRAWIISIGRRDADKRVAHLMLELYVRSAASG